MTPYYVHTMTEMTTPNVVSLPSREPHGLVSRVRKSGTRRHAGYTLLEMIVSVGIFSIVMLAVTSAYLSLIKLDKESRGTADLVTNLSFVIDSMQREIRAGTAYKCNNTPSPAANCAYPSTAGTSFGFTDSRTPARQIVYSLSNNQIFIAITDGGTTVTSALTDPRIRVTSLSFYVSGEGTAGGNNVIQPQVFFTVRGTMTLSATKDLSFSLQGAATQRLLEVFREVTNLYV